MPIQLVNIGTGPDTGDGDNIRDAFNKVNTSLSTLDTGNTVTPQIDTSESITQTGSIAGLINGSNTAFTNSAGSYKAGSCLIFVNGMPTFAWAETSAASGIITFTNPPQAGDEIIWWYVPDA